MVEKFKRPSSILLSNKWDPLFFSYCTNKTDSRASNFQLVNTGISGVTFLNKKNSGVQTAPKALATS
jgi:hypothetical protein